MAVAACVWILLWLLWVVIQYLDQYLQNSEPKTQPQHTGSSTPYANLLFLFSVYVRAKLLTVSLELRTMNNKLNINRVCHLIEQPPLPLKPQ